MWHPLLLGAELDPLPTSIIHAPPWLNNIKQLIHYLVSKPYHFTMVEAVEPFKLHPTSMSHTYIRCVGGTFSCCGWAYGCTHIPYRYHHRYLPRFERIGWNPCPWLCMCSNHATMLWVRLYLYQSTFRTASHIHFIHIYEVCKVQASSTVVDGHMAVHSHYYHHRMFSQIWKSWL
jgi:hypothetical protein